MARVGDVRMRREDEKEEKEEMVEEDEKEEKVEMEGGEK